MNGVWRGDGKSFRAGGLVYVPTYVEGSEGVISAISSAVFPAGCCLGETTGVTTVLGDESTAFAAPQCTEATADGPGAPQTLQKRMVAGHVDRH